MDIVDWPAFVVGSAFAIVGVVQVFRQLEAREAWDGERPGVKRYRRSENPRAYWSIIALHTLMAVIGFGVILYTLWGLQP